jgi:pilus assembly protein TadC
MTPRARLLAFTLLVGVITILSLGLLSFDLPYTIRYLILLIAIALYVTTIAALETLRRRRRRKQPKRAL